MNGITTRPEYRKIQGVVKRGSFGLTLPKKYALDLGLQIGEFVKIQQDNDKIIIEKLESA